MPRHKWICAGHAPRTLRGGLATRSVVAFGNIGVPFKALAKVAREPAKCPFGGSLLHCCFRVCSKAYRTVSRETDKRNPEPTFRANGEHQPGLRVRLASQFPNLVDASQWEDKALGRKTPLQSHCRQAHVVSKDVCKAHSPLTGLSCQTLDLFLEGVRLLVRRKMYLHSLPSESDRSGLLVHLFLTSSWGPG